ncbi:MAG: DUF4838 domain-containing protein [Verrucomicrobiia bacterium]|jgi:hypothetical protein
MLNKTKLQTLINLLGITILILQNVNADIFLSKNGKPQYEIINDLQSSPPEKWAARELARVLSKIVGAEFQILQTANANSKKVIIVGRGSLAKKYFPEIDFDALGSEEVIIKTSGDRLLISGGRPRGTIYAVSRFLQTQCGVRYWTPWAEKIPSNPNLTIKSLNIREKPAFESRDPYWYPAFNAEWAVRNFSNSQSAGIPDELGGCIKYRGFVHTFYPLVPPDKYFESHPDWYSMIDGKRTYKNAQLCLSNPELKDFVVERVKQWLKESPKANIISISQNDWHGNCQCPKCKEIDEREGSPSGSLLEFINYIAEKIEPEFPNVAIDTLAYQYTRKPPKTMKPRDNVIIRLCSIECNFREPLYHESNAKFAEDILGWSKICKRLYIWDYTTDFAHYIQPHPNWFVLGENLRFFHKHNVRGVFEQGAYQSYGSEMAELRAWLLAQLLYNPYQDDRALIKEFLEGYYGPAADKIRQYMDLMYAASKGYYLSCFSKTDTPFHNYKTLSQAEQLLAEAETAVAGDTELLARVMLVRLPVRYVWLVRWTQLRKECKDAGAKWILPESRKEVANQWLQMAKGFPNKPWTQVKLINESGLTPEKFIERFATDPKEN